MSINSECIACQNDAKQLERQMSNDRENDKPIVSKWIPTRDPLILRRMGKLGEEINELGAVASRVIIQGMDEMDPSSGEVNRNRLIKEIADVYAQLDETVARLYLPVDFIEQRRAIKRDCMQRWEAMFVEDAQS